MRTRPQLPSAFIAFIGGQFSGRPFQETIFCQTNPPPLESKGFTVSLWAAASLLRAQAPTPSSSTARSSPSTSASPSPKPSPYAATASSPSPQSNRSPPSPAPTRAVSISTPQRRSRLHRQPHAPPARRRYVDEGSPLRRHLLRKQAVDLLRARLKAAAAGDWVYNIGGWTHHQFTDDPRPFTRDELDALAPDNPVACRSLTIRSFLNSRALALLKSKPANRPPNFLPGTIQRDGSASLPAS